MKWRRPRYTEHEKALILAGLLRLRAAGKIQGVWFADDKLHVRYLAVGEPDFLPWWEAAEMTGYRTVEPLRVSRLKFRPLLRPGRYGNAVRMEERLTA